ncbi:14077_t:CDS:1, partial [Dentiscutata heterogama]
CVEYNAVTRTPNVKMQITVLYSSQSVRFQKYLGPSGSNIKLGNTYFISGLIKFSTSGKMMLEATDVDYLKTLNMNYNVSESSSSTGPSTRTIIDIIADDVESVTAQKQEEHMDSLVKYDTTATRKSSENLSEIINADAKSNPSHGRKKFGQMNYVDLDTEEDKKEILSEHEDKVTDLNEEANSQEENKESEDHQPKKRKR